MRSVSCLNEVVALAEISPALRVASRMGSETGAAESARMTAITSRQCKDGRMTRSDFNHLLGSIKALSPEQVRQLRRELDSQLAQAKKPAAPTPGKAAKRAKPAAPRKK